MFAILGLLTGLLCGLIGRITLIKVGLFNSSCLCDFLLHDIYY